MKIECKEFNISEHDIHNEIDIEKLLYYIRHIEFKISTMRIAINNYKADYIESGVSGDFEWFKRIQLKLSLFLLFSKAVQARINYLKREQKTQNNEQVLFIKRAKEILPKKLYKLIKSNKH